MRKNDRLRNPDMASRPDIHLTEEMRRLPMPKEQSCRAFPKVKCPVKGSEYCVYDLRRITPVETDYACPACGEVIKKDVFTTGGWKTLVLDRRHEP